ncbi:hypothetical protein FHG87_018824 [Trinorchestia longiramus]|nr:hypothetical protein FHG87_018824 [Trinorchestia longiramus]
MAGAVSPTSNTRERERERKRERKKEREIEKEGEREEERERGLQVSTSERLDREVKVHAGPQAPLLPP